MESVAGKSLPYTLPTLVWSPALYISLYMSPGVISAHRARGNPYPQLGVAQNYKTKLHEVSWSNIKLIYIEKIIW